MEWMIQHLSEELPTFCLLRRRPRNSSGVRRAQRNAGGRSDSAEVAPTSLACAAAR